MASAGSSAKALSQLFEAIDGGSLDALRAGELQHEGANLALGLLHAVRGGRTAAVLVLAGKLDVKLGAPSAAAEPPTDQDLLSQASRGNWAWVAYHAAAAEPAELLRRLRARDARACAELQQLAGAVRVRLPRDLRNAFLKTGRLSADHPDLFVEQKRWLLPRPEKEDCFARLNMETGRPEDSKKLEEGWYTVVQYPLDDDLREAVLRRREWGALRGEEALLLVQDPSRGERLLSKAVKARQWELVEWLLEGGRLDREDAASVVQQAEEEFVHVWGEGPCAERRALLREHGELAELCGLLDEGGVLRKPWRQGPLKVPAGAVLLSPSRQALNEALSLEGLSLEALRLIGGARVRLAVPPPPEVARRWALDLSGIVRTPLLHLAVRHGPEKLLKPLLPLVSDTDAVDARGLNALVAAAEESRWAAAELLLKAGCSADGRSGYVASEAASRWCNNSAIPEEERETARNLLNTIDECRERPPFRTLAEYFGRQAFGPRGAAGEPGRGRQPELVHGRQPRRFKSQDGQLCLAGGNLRIFARAMVFSKEAEQHEVRFVPLGAAAYGEAVEAEMLDLADRPLLREEALPQCPDELAVPVLLPPQCLRLGADGKERAVTLGLAGEPALELGLPVLAFAPPMGQLRVESCSACCKVAIGRVDVLVDGVRIDATPLVGGMGMPEEDVQSAMEVPVPLKNLKVEAQFSGRQVASERVEVVANADGASRHLQVVSDDPMKAVLEGERSICRCEVGEQCGLLVEVPLAVYVYQQTVDEVEQIDFVYVAGHKADVPDDAETFVGTVEWDGGSKRVDAQAPYVELKGGGCLTLLESMKFKPDLPPGRKFESTEWENTGTCQFWRILGVPRRTGKIENA